MTTFTRKELGLMAGMAAALLISGSVALCVNLTNTARRGELTRLAAESRDAQAGSGDLEELSGQISRLGEQVRKAEPRTLDRGAILEQMSKFTQKRGLDLGRVQTLGLIETEAYTGVPMVLETSGRYRELYGLLRFIEAHEWLMRVDRIDLIGSDREESDRLKSNIQVTTFVWKDAK